MHGTSNPLCLSPSILILKRTARRDRLKGRTWTFSRRLSRADKITLIVRHGSWKVSYRYILRWHKDYNIREGTSHVILPNWINWFA